MTCLERGSTDVTVSGGQLKLVRDLIRNLLRRVLVSIVRKVYCAPVSATNQVSQASGASPPRAHLS